MLRIVPAQTTGPADGDDVGVAEDDEDAPGRSTPGGNGSVCAAIYAPTPAHARKTATHPGTLTHRPISGGRGA
jgi:hypothetical protein